VLARFNRGAVHDAAHNATALSVEGLLQRTNLSLQVGQYFQTLLVNQVRSDLQETAIHR
jgi:hypothetical protein